MVQSCSDGDTCTVQVEGLSFRVRLLGIDAPEVAHKGRPGQPFGQDAKEALNALVAGKRLEVTQHGIDSYNRPLVTIAVGETLVNEELVRRGLAEVWEGKSTFNLTKLRLLQGEARKSKRGIWSLGEAYVSPHLFRKRLAPGDRK
jgi:endonuclease YncB( thermonuclease family)